MPYIAYSKATLLMSSGPGKHLHVVMTDANDTGKQHLLLSISTIRTSKYYDPQCIIKAGEHPFLISDSFVEYKFALQTDAKNLSTCVDGQIFIPKEDMNDKLFYRICDGIEKSEHTPRWAITFFNNNA